MRQRCRTATIVGGSLLAVGLLWFALLKYYLFRHPCDQLDTLLSRNSEGAKAVDVFRACTAIGTSVVERVDLVTAKGRRIRLLTFVPWDGEVPRGVNPIAPFSPSAAWVTAHDLDISIGTVGRVLQERTEAAGVRVKFDIQVVLSERRHAPAAGGQDGGTELSPRHGCHGTTAEVAWTGARTAARGRWPLRPMNVRTQPGGGTWRACAGCHYEIFERGDPRGHSALGPAQVHRRAPRARSKGLPVGKYRQPPMVRVYQEVNLESRRAQRRSDDGRRIGLLERQSPSDLSDGNRRVW